MNNNYKVIKEIRISHGGITETAVDVRIIIRDAIINNATILACVHNHPSGQITPSTSDNDLTKAIDNACKLMRIRFCDHVIVGQGLYYSYHENGYI